MSVRRAYSQDGSDGAYSDDFLSEDDDRATHSPYNNRRAYTHNGDGGGGRGADSRDRIRARGGGGVQRGRGRGRSKRGGGRGNSRASEPISMKHDTVTKRVLSASRNRINELRNQVEEQKLIIKDLAAENKLFKKLQFRQEKAIKHFEDKENDLPRILEKHSNETRVMKDQNRKLREKFDRTDHYLRDAEDELERVKKRMNKYKDMCEQKELQERDELSRKLTKAEIDMEEKDVKIKEVERHMEILKKNHRHELGIEMARQKDLKRQIEELTNKNNEIDNQLKDKSKQLEYKNIYSQSIVLNSQENGSVDASPSRKVKKGTSMTDLTPRDKAKFYEEKRREEVRKQKHLKAGQDKKKRQQWEKEEKDREKERERMPSKSPRRDPSRSPRRDPSQSPRREREFNFSSVDKGLEEKERDLNSRKRYREEQEEYRRQSERDRQDLLDKKRDLERRQEEDRGRRHEEEDRLRREKEDREWKQREEREREERERREKDDRQRRDEEERQQKKEKAERERREKEKAEQERRIQQEKEKLDNDPALREERRKKDELLRKLQDMDKIGNNPPPKKDPEAFGSKENMTGYDTPSSKKSEPKEYSFTNPVLNLHKGKPARDDVTVPYIQRQRQKASKDDDEFGYTPSFGPGRVGGNTNKSSTKPLSLFDDDSPSTLKFDTSSNTTTNKKPDKSSNLLENLFGPNSTTTNTATTNKSEKLSKGQDSDTFFITSPKREPKKMNGSATSAFPWDNASSSPVKSNASKSTFDRGGSSTIFGGGAAIVDDDVSSNSSRALPRRARQTNVSTFSAKPSVTAVDPFDDEIEEVVL